MNAIFEFCMRIIAQFKTSILSFRLQADPSPARGKKYQFSRIPDLYNSIDEVQVALRAVGLESSSLIFGIDFTKSNTRTGKVSFERRCLHDTTGPLNPYQQVLSIMGRTLEAFDDDHLIPTFGFGDIHTADKACFPFFPDRPCAGLQEAQSRYLEIAPGIELSGPTNFAPVINKAIETVQQTKAYHILVIIADGQVSNVRETVDAIVRASSHPLSIVMVGVGDGPWDMMRQFDDELPQRKFDNFQFVCFTELQRRLAKVMGDGRGRPAGRADAWLAMAMLMEVPEQYRAIKKLRLL